MPLFDVFWAMLWFFLWVGWIWVLISVVGDIFRNRDSSGSSKAMWTIFVILVPWLGVLSYLIANGDGMAERQLQADAAQDQAARAYIQSAAGTSASTADELQKLAGLKDSGVITAAQFESQKAKLLA